MRTATVREFGDQATKYSKRHEFATKLRNAGCNVDTAGTDWVEAGDFVDPQARVPTGQKRRRRLKS